ncbi:MAG: hypothetical protein J4F46_07220 [Dehalococcoidia bacterium]|nr:hypothetical protein [Dehalococcoidia bacterium]
MTNIIPTWAWGVVAAVFLAAFRVTYWWPNRWWSARQKHAGQETSSRLDASGLLQFNELLPLIQRQIKATRPIRDLKELFHQDPFGIVAFRADREELIARLDALTVPHPSPEAIRIIWFRYLLQVEPLVNAGKLVEARQLKVSGNSLDAKE